MPFTNFDSRHFTDAETTTLNTALTSLETAFSGKLANLSPEERQQFGSVNEQNKLIINKVKDFHLSQPELSSPDVDWVEFQNDYNTRVFLQTSIQRLQSLIDGLGNAKILHDWDNYQASLTDYDFAKYKLSTHSAGFETKVNEVGQFFKGGNPSASTKAKNNTDTTLVE